MNRFSFCVIRFDFFKSTIFESQNALYVHYAVRPTALHLRKAKVKKSNENCSFILIRTIFRDLFEWENKSWSLILWRIQLCLNSFSVTFIEFSFNDDLTLVLIFNSTFPTSHLVRNIVFVFSIIAFSLAYIDCNMFEKFELIRVKLEQQSNI